MNILQPGNWKVTAAQHSTTFKEIRHVSTNEEIATVWSNEGKAQIVAEHIAAVPEMIALLKSLTDPFDTLDTLDEANRLLKRLGY